MPKIVCFLRGQSKTFSQILDKIMQKEGAVVPTKSITRVPASPLLGIPTIGIPLNGYSLLPV